MIRKLIPVVLIASLAACANTGRQASPTDTDSTTSSAPSASTDSYGSTESPGATDSGSTGGAYGAGYGAPLFGSRGCDAQPVQKMIGTRLTSSVENQIKQESSSTRIRVLKPGEVMTMEYDPQRINLILDQQGALTALRCG
jgi:hypothetical protein